MEGYKGDASMNCMSKELEVSGEETPLSDSEVRGL